MLKNPNYVYGDHTNFVPGKLNFGEYILDKMWELRDNICLINGVTNESLTYGHMAQQAMNLAVSLRHLSVRRGQTVALCSENRNEFFSTVIGVVCTGASLTTLNTGYTKGEIKHVMNISKPKYLFCSPTNYKINEKTYKSLEFVKKIIIFGDERPHANSLLYNDLVIPNNGVNFSGLTSNVKFDEFEAVDVLGQSDTMFILYSSGTTGLPKGVMLTHLNVMTSCSLPPFCDPALLGLSVLPWYHVYGLVSGLTGMSVGRTSVFLPKFEEDLYLKTIEKYKIALLTVVPPILVVLCKVMEDFKYEVSSVRLIFSGAAPLHRDTAEAVAIKFPTAVVLQGYGMTEVTLAVAMDTLERASFAKPGGVGFLVASTTLKIVDTETRKPLGPYQRGEICVKGPLIMKGYMGHDMKDNVDDEGFMRTGDIGYYDEDKYFFVVDRLKELIKYKGYQVPPAEIEALLLQHEGIKDAGVVGIDHKTAGEVPLAFVVTQPGVTLTEGEVKAFVAERLSNPKRLRGGVRFLTEIPKSPSGKILRKNLKLMAKTSLSKL